MAPVLIRLFPLNRRRGFGGDVVEDAVDAGDGVDDAGADAVEDVVGYAGPVGGHKVGGGDAPECQCVVVGPAVAHYAERGDSDRVP